MDSTPPTEPAKKKKYNPPPRFALMLALLAPVMGIYEFIDLGKMEAENGARHINGVIAILYDSLGRYGVLIFFLAVGAFWGFLILRKGRRQRD